MQPAAIKTSPTIEQVTTFVCDVSIHHSITVSVGIIHLDIYWWYKLVNEMQIPDIGVAIVEWNRRKHGDRNKTKSDCVCPWLLLLFSNGIAWCMRNRDCYGFRCLLLCFQLSTLNGFSAAATAAIIASIRVALTSTWVLYIILGCIFICSQIYATNKWSLLL